MLSAIPMPEGGWVMKLDAKRFGLLSIFYSTRNKKKKD